MSGRDVFDGLAFSGTWVALAAGALVAAVARVLGADVAPAALVLAFAGTFAVYAADRLRDVQHDAITSPLRTAFVRRHRRALTLACVASAAVAVGAALSLGGPALVVSAVAGGLGALHRYFKRVPFFKAAYVSAAWLAVIVGLPAVTGVPGAAPARVAWACAIVGPALVANAVAFSARDAEAAAARLGVRSALRLGLGFAALGAVAALFAPGELRVLAAVPAATGLALAGFRRDERYVSLVVDGALVLGALVVMAQ